MRHKFTNEEIEFLRANAAGTKTVILTQMFNERFNLDMSESSITNTLFRYNIKIGVRFGCFEKGHKTHNKGLKWDDYMSKEAQNKCLQTSFKKDENVNNQRHNWRDVGEEYIDNDGYVLVRLEERKGNRSSHQFWKAKHYIIWEEHNGEVPKGYNVIFADGNRRNFDIDNLVLVSNAELLYMNRNNLYYKDYAEGTKTGALIAKMITKGKGRKNAKK